MQVEILDDTLQFIYLALFLIEGVLKSILLLPCCVALLFQALTVQLVSLSLLAPVLALPSLIIVVVLSGQLVLGLRRRYRVASGYVVMRGVEIDCQAADRWPKHRMLPPESARWAPFTLENGHRRLVGHQRRRTEAFRRRHDHALLVGVHRRLDRVRLRTKGSSVLPPSGRESTARGSLPLSHGAAPWQARPSKWLAIDLRRGTRFAFGHRIS